MENKNLVYLSVDVLHHHPDNPRKEIGDVTELAESIKAKGIMQNLTVVPFVSKIHPGFKAEGNYTVLIGHRRLEAAKLAGLETVPCVIVEMSEADQVATMLLENIQRNDLSIYEQAKGFQMMLDLGDTVAGISEKSGFSETTIRRRVKLAELDEKKLKALTGRQITMKELDELNSVESVNDRNKLLDEIGTSNFKWKLQSVLATERRKKEEQKAREILIEAGLAEIPYKDRFGDQYAYSDRRYLYSSEIISEYKRKKDEDFFAVNHGTVYLCYEMSEEHQKNKKAFFAEEEKKRLAEKERMDKLRALFKQAYESRKEFVENLSKSVIMKRFDVIIAFLFYMRAENVGGYAECGDIINALGFDFDEFSENEESLTFEDVYAVTSRISQEENVFKFILLEFDDKSDKTCLTWDGTYRESKTILEWYAFLGRLGYEMSDEEKTLINGTHKLYKKV